jgi:uncharacterized protein
MRPHLARHRWRLLMALALGLATLLGCATLDQKQREWIFQPSQRTWWGGAQAAEGMQDVWITLPAEDGDQPGAGQDGERLHGLWLPQPRADAPVLLYLHGARWDVRSSAHRMRRMHELGFAVLGIDYRGFGQSSPRLPSEQSALADARSAWRWLALKQPTAPRFVFGHSLGGAIAVALAAEVGDEHGLLVEGSFTNIPDVVASYPMGWLPVGPLITQRFDAGARIASVGSPVLVVHGSEDRTIKPELGRALYNKAINPKRFILVEGGSHHNTNALGQALYRDALRELFGLNPT